MIFFRKPSKNSKYNINELYVVTTGNADYSISSNVIFPRYSYHPNSISIVSLKNLDSKSCKDVVTGQKYYLFDNNNSIHFSRIYCANMSPLYNFFVGDNERKNILKKGIISLDEICMFLTEMNDSFYREVFNNLEII